MSIDRETELRAEHEPHELYDKLYTCIRRDRRLDLKAKYVYTYIAGLARKSRICFATNATLANELGISVTSIKSAIATLARHGIISVSFESSAHGTRRVIRVPRLAEIYALEVDWEAEADLSQPAFGYLQADVDSSQSDDDRLQSEAVSIRDVIRDQRQNDQTNTPLPPGTGDGEGRDSSFSLNDVQTVWEAFCAEAGLDVQAATTKERRRSLKIAQELLAEGFTAEEVVACTSWLKTQEWRRQPVTFAVLAREIGLWRMAGRPLYTGSARDHWQVSDEKTYEIVMDCVPVPEGWLPDDWTWHKFNRAGIPHEWLHERTADFRRNWQVETWMTDADLNQVWIIEMERQWDHELARALPESAAARDRYWNSDVVARFEICDDTGDDQYEESYVPLEPVPWDETDPWLPRPAPVPAPHTSHVA